MLRHYAFVVPDIVVQAIAGDLAGIPSWGWGKSYSDFWFQRYTNLLYGCALIYLCQYLSCESAGKESLPYPIITIPFVAGYAIFLPPLIVRVNGNGYRFGITPCVRGICVVAHSGINWAPSPLAKRWPMIRTRKG